MLLISGVSRLIANWPMPELMMSVTSVETSLMNSPRMPQPLKVTPLNVRLLTDCAAIARSPVVGSMPKPMSASATR